jgi:hypothetical protein
MELVFPVQQLASCTYERNEDNLMTGLPRTNPASWRWMVGLFVLGALAVSNSTAQVQTAATKTKASKTVKAGEGEVVTGKVWYASAVILTLNDGKNQEFKIPHGQEFNIDSHMTDASGLGKGMQISAAKAVETPTDLVTRHARIAGTMPAPPLPPPQDATIPVVEEMSEPAPVKTGQAAPARPPAILPKTASPVPLIGFLGLFTVAVALTIRALRTR